MVVGYGFTANDDSYHATLWDGSVLTDLGTLGGAISSAFAINDVGATVGFSRTSDNSVHATLWDGDGITDLNTYLDDESMNAGWILEYAYGINDNGWIVGNAQNSITGQTHGFLLSTAVVPIPATLWLFTSGMIGLIGVARKRNGA